MVKEKQSPLQSSERYGEVWGWIGPIRIIIANHGIREGVGFFYSRFHHIKFLNDLI